LSEPVCAIVGVGPGNGAAFARYFAEAGARVALCARSLPALQSLAAGLPGAHAYAYDARDPDSAALAFEQIRGELGPITTLIYNAGSAVFGNIDSLDLEAFRAAWEVNTAGLFVAARQVLPDMRQAGGGNLVVIGATASWKANPGFTAFASAKAAQRALAQALARQLGPENVHVAYVIVDGVIDIPRTRTLLPDRPDDFFLKADEIARAVLFLTRQDRSAWTFELDLRPFCEKW
jgi:NADP-dependent 3-hydroxy acid dehydrogenase YdfG